MNSPNSHANNLDSLRGLLSIVVVAAHGWQIFAHPLDAGAVTWGSYVFGMSARLAVLAFFALSGFVITLSIAANVQRHGGFSAREFVFGRVFRIAPPLLVIIGLTFALQLALALMGSMSTSVNGAARAHFITDVGQQLLALVTLCLRGQLSGAWLNGPLWSLVFEIQLYVLAGLLATLLASTGWRWRVVAAVLLAMYLNGLGLLSFADSGLSLQTLSFAAFLAGALACRFKDAARRAVLAVVAAALAAAALRFLGAEGKLIGDIDTDPALLACQVALAIAFAGGIVLAARGGAWRLLRGSGAYSYTLYIGHFPLLLAIYFVVVNGAPRAFNPWSAPIIAIASVLLVWGVLAKLGRWVERPQLQRQTLARLLASDAPARRGGATLLALVAAVTIAMASSAVPARPALQLFGDSTQVQLYPLLRDRLGQVVANNAVGETRSDMLLGGTDGRNAPWPGSVQGSVLLINHGMNDARPWAKVPVATYRVNLHRLASAPAQVIFQTPNPSTYPGRDTAPYAQAMREVATELGLRFIDVHTCFMRQPNWQARLPDGVHPDMLGRHWIVDECLIPGLQSVLALRRPSAEEIGSQRWVVTGVLATP